MSKWWWWWFANLLSDSKAYSSANAVCVLLYGCCPVLSGSFLFSITCQLMGLSKTAIKHYYYFFVPTSTKPVGVNIKEKCSNVLWPMSIKHHFHGCQKRRWYVLLLLSGAISSTWLYLFFTFFNGCNVDSFGGHCVLEGDRVPLLKGHIIIIINNLLLLLLLLLLHCSSWSGDKQVVQLRHLQRFLLIDFHGNWSNLWRASWK